MPRPTFPYRWGKFKPPPGSRIDMGHQLAQGLIGAWLANEVGGTLLYDATGKQAPLTATGAPSWAPGVPTGFHGRSFVADASNYYSGGAVLTSDTFSMLAGVTPNGFTVAEIFGCDVAAAANLRMDTSGFAKLMLVKAATAVIAAGATVLVAGRPYVAGCVNTPGGSAKVFLDGYVDGTGSGTTYSHGNLQVGKSSAESGSPGFNGGTISFLYLWDRALLDVQMIQVSQGIYDFVRPPARVWGAKHSVLRTLRLPVPLETLGWVFSQLAVPLESRLPVDYLLKLSLALESAGVDPAQLSVVLRVLTEVRSPLIVQLDVVPVETVLESLLVLLDVLESNGDQLEVTLDVVDGGLHQRRTSDDVQAPVAVVTLP